MKLTFLPDDYEENATRHKYIARPKSLSGNYGCMITFEKDNLITEIKYKLNIDFFKGTNGANIFKIIRADALFINDLQPDSHLDQLAFETSNVLYPLELEVLNDGSINRITNYKEIKERWVYAEEKIRTYYKGQLADKYLELTNRTLEDEKRLISKIAKDWVLYMYFILFNKYDFKESMMQFPTAGKAIAVNYKVTHKVESRPEVEDLIIRIKGVIEDERCALDLEQELDYPYFRGMDKNKKDLNGTCNISYSLSDKTRIIEGIEAEFITAYIDPKKITIKMFLLDRAANKIKNTKSDFLI